MYSMTGKFIFLKRCLLLTCFLYLVSKFFFDIIPLSILCQQLLPSLWRDRHSLFCNFSCPFVFTFDDILPGGWGHPGCRTWRRQRSPHCQWPGGFKTLLILLMTETHETTYAKNPLIKWWSSTDWPFGIAITYFRWWQRSSERLNAGFSC